MLRAHAAAHAAIDWRAAVISGLIAAVVFLAAEMVMVPLFLGESPWGPPRMMAAIVLGESVLPAPGSAPAPPDARVWIFAMVVHTVLSIVFAVILAALIARLPSNAALAVGVAFGVTLYFVNFYGFTALFPWFAMARNWVSIVAHAIFGFSAAWAYQSLARAAPSPA